MTISIIMAGYNAEHTIERAITSVLAQTNPDWQLIVIDDGSTDSTGEILANLHTTLADDRIIMILGEPNVGVAEARNKALRRATGDWITFLDSDDEFTPQRIQIGYDHITDDIDMIVCRHQLVQANGVVHWHGTENHDDLPGKEVAAGILSEHFTSFPWDKLLRTSTIHHVEFVNVRQAENQIYTVAAAIRSRSVRFINEAPVRYHVSADSLTWGHVATVAETELLLRSLGEAAAILTSTPTGKRSLRTSRVANYLAAAQQSIFQGESPRSLRRQYSIFDVIAALKQNRRIGVDGLLFKLFPRIYSFGKRRRLRGQLTK
ncbi:MAG: glycosyltransferase family 2 protein [Propionibacteriaceae bacterium]